MDGGVRGRQARFPSWCAGPCGCMGANTTQPHTWAPVTGENGAVTGGELSCPDAAVDKVRAPPVLLVISDKSHSIGEVLRAG